MFNYVLVLNIALWKKKPIKKNLAANLKVVVEKVTHSLYKEVREDFHEFLRADTDILLKNVHSTKDDTCLIGKKDVGKK